MSEDGSGDEPQGAAPRDAEDAVLRHAAGRAPRAGEEELFAALDRTRADLAVAPVPPLPAGFAASLQERLAAERAARGDVAEPDDGGRPARVGPASSGPPPHPVPHPSSDSAPRIVSRPDSRPDSRPPAGRPAGRGTPGPGRRRRRVLAAALGALVVVAGVTGVVLTGSGPARSPAPTAAPTVPRAPAPVSVSTADPVQALRAGLGAADPGPLADPGRRAGCLAAHGLPAGTVPVGTRQVVLDGRSGTLLVLTTGVAARFRVLVVGPNCTADRPDTLADLTVGG